MSVYVDALRDYTKRADLPPRMRRHWCHMLADSEAELHAFARRLGLRREWYQGHRNPYRRHYDLTASKRALALQLGALPLDEEEWSDKMFAWMRANRAGGAEEQP